MLNIRIQAYSHFRMGSKKRGIGEGAATASRASFGKQLNDISNYNEAQILAGDDGWNPVENGNVLLQNLKR